LKLSIRKKNNTGQLRVKSKTENLSEIRDFVSFKALEAGIPQVTGKHYP
jgi:hypothetical protein